MCGAHHCDGGPEFVLVELSPAASRDLAAMYRRELQRQLRPIRRELGIIEKEEEHIMSDQDQINADVAAIQGVVTDLTGAVSNIQDEIAALKAANPGLDLSGLDSAVASLQGVQASVDSLETPAAPPADGGDTTGDDGSGNTPAA